MIQYVVIGVLLLALRALAGLFISRKQLRDAPAPTGKKVAVIGCGVSGLVSVKELSQEGFDVVAFEKSPSMGGVWHFDKDKAKKQTSGQVWTSLITTSSTYVTSFSDFTPTERTDDVKSYPHCKDHPYHMSHRQYRQYLEDYQNEFDLKKHIKCNMGVKKMVQKDDKWVLKLFDAKTQDPLDDQTFDFVVVASGQHQETKIPDNIPGLKKFKGGVIHSTQYFSADKFKGKRVMVVGAGDSGADIVKHVADVSKPGCTYLTLRNGAHVLPRMGAASLVRKVDYPADYNIMRGQFYLSAARRQQRLSDIETNIKEVYLKTKNKVAAEVYRMHHMLNGRTEDQYFATKSFQFCRALADGSAKLKPGIETFTETGCRFKSKTTVKNDENICTPIDDSEVELDDVILCTGFKQVFPFLPDGFEEHSHLERYCLVFHPKLKNVGFVGFVRPSGLGSIPTLAEMQARWITQVFKGAAPLPNEANMKKAIAQHVDDFQIHRPITMGHVFVVWLLYLTKIATFIDASPPMATLFFTDYKLWYRMMFQPMTTHQFRLVGPHAKPEYVRKILMGGNKASQYSNQRIHKGHLMLEVITCYVLSCIPVIGSSYTPLLMKGKIVADK